MALLVAIRAVLSWPISDPTRRLIEFATHRLIGTVRREYLDRVFFWNAVGGEFVKFSGYGPFRAVLRATWGMIPFCSCAICSS